MTGKTQELLVTGGAGYIGAHTVIELLKAGIKPVLIDDFSASDRTLLNGVTTITGQSPIFYEGNCNDRQFLNKVFKSHPGISRVIHFAAFKSVSESVKDPLKYYHNNVGGMVSLLQVMSENNVRDIVFSSSCTVYGEPDEIPVSESAPMKPAESPYGATKQMCERILQDESLNGLRVISLRYFNPIGAHPSAVIGELPIGVPNNLVPYLTQTAIGKRDKLTVFGNDYNTPDGSCIRDFIHVVDLAHAHVNSIKYLDSITDKNCYRVFNVGTGEGVSVLQLIGKFEKATGVKLEYTIGARRTGDVEKTYADPRNANKNLNWRSQYTVEEALLHAWNWEKKLAAK
jgi:UDP-glucose 4-epimerase